MKRFWLIPLAAAAVSAGLFLSTARAAPALTLLDTDPEIDLILTDLRLPDGTGLELLQKVRERSSPPAVVLVTGQGDQEVAVTALKSGAADYLVKQSDYLHRLPVVISKPYIRRKSNINLWSSKSQRWFFWIRRMPGKPLFT